LTLAVLVFSAAIVTALLGPPLATAAFPGANGTIAFERHLNQFEGDIYTIRANGTGLANVSNNPRREGAPAWSADGRRIAFTVPPSDCQPDLCNDIWVMNADGSGQTTITSGHSDYAPAWSADGQKIAFTTLLATSEPDYYVEALYTVDANGSNRQHLPVGDGVIQTYDSSPSWSPDGQKIAYATGEYWCEPDEGCYYQPTDIATANANGSGSSNLTGTANRNELWPDWSPDGTRIAFTEYDEFGTEETDIWIMNANGSGKVNLTNTPGVGESLPAWSPDGTKIAFVASDGDYELWTVNPDGSGRARVTNNTITDYDPSWQPLSAAAHPRPGSATPLRVPLVPSYGQCTAPNSEHVGPLDLPSCDPPATTSATLTMSDLGRGSGHVRLKAIPGNGSTSADEADLVIFASVSDVRCRTVFPGCPVADGDYEGKLLLRAPLRITDRQGLSDTSTTAEDNELLVPIQCAPSASANIGSNCVVDTTADALVPGFIREQKRTVISAFSLEIRDAGPNGTGYDDYCPFLCGDGDESVYMTQGVFAP
jgi:Tol biopolymer transport system component